MKQSKRLLCVLLSMIMILSGLTVGASAIKTDYNQPAGYTNVNKPYFSIDQASTALLDFLDDILANDVDVNEEYVGIEIRIQSIDTTFNTIKNVLKKAGILTNICGDIDDLDATIPKNDSIRRSNASMTDTLMTQYLLQFFAANADPLYKIADNTLDLGVIGWFYDMQEEIPILNDLHGYLNETVYKLLINEDGLNDDGSTFTGSSVTLDSIIQDFINNRCLNLICDGSANDDGTNDIADFLGLPTKADGTLASPMGLLDLCPSLTADDININTTSTYDLIENLFDALIDDVVVKFAGELILDALEIDPEDPAGDTSYINIAITLFVTPEKVGLPEDAAEADVIAAFLEQQGVENPTAPKPIDKTNAALKYILKEGITEYINFVDDGNGGKYLHINDDFMAQLSDYIKSLLPVLASLVSDFRSLTTAETEALSAMNQEQTFAFLVKYLLENLVDGIIFPDGCDSIMSLVTYTLVNVAAELEPDIDFEAKIANGEINPDSLDCLEVGAVVARYYLVGEFGMEIPVTASFEEVLNYAFDFFLEKYSTFFNIYPNADAKATYSGNVWYKVYRSAGDWVRLTSLCYGVEDSWSGLRDLLMNKIVGNILNFDINGLLSIIGRRPSSANGELEKPIAKLLVNLVARVLNGLFHLDAEKDSNASDVSAQKNLIVPYSYGTLDQVTTNVNSDGTGLKNTVKMLLAHLPNITGEGTLLGSSLDMVVELIGIIDLDDFEVVAMMFKSEQSGMTHSLASLRTLVETLDIPENEGVKYYEDDYAYFNMVDFAPWAYLEYKEKMKKAKAVIEQYDEALANPEKNVFPTKTEITYAYYALEKTDEILESNKRTVSTYQLNKEYNKATALNLTNPGDTTYSIRTWKAYTNAMNFANKVFTEVSACNGVGYRQSKINEARRQLIDAIAGLKPYTGLADYAALESTVERTIGINNPERFTQASINKLVEAYKTAIYLDKDYGSDEQKIVDHAYEVLNKAIDNLKSETFIEVYDTTVNHVDEVNNLIYGLGENYYSESDKLDWGDDFTTFFMSNNGMVNLGDDYAGMENYTNIAPTENGNGTGAKIQVTVPTDSGSMRVIKEYSMVVMGDLTGDGKIDGTDAVIMKTYATLMQDTEFAAKCTLAAGDLNLDGNITGTDITTVLNVAINVKNASIEQCPEAISSQVRIFADIL